MIGKNQTLFCLTSSSKSFQSSFSLFTVLFFLPILGIGQHENRIDSLKQELQITKGDTSKVWIYRDIAYYLLETDLDSAISYSEKGIQLAQELNFINGQIWTIYQKALALEFADSFTDAMASYGQALDLAIAQDDLTAMAKITNAMGVANYYQGHLDKALYHYLQALEYSENGTYLEGIGQALNNMGVIYRQRRQFSKALEVYNKAIEVKKQENDQTGLINAYYNLGLLYSYNADFEASLEAFKVANAYAAKEQDQRAVAEINIGKGVALYNLGKEKEAESFLKKGLDNLKKDKPHEKASALAYLGILEVKSGDGAKGLAKLNMALSMVSQSGRLELRRLVFKELANAHEILGNAEKSVEFWKAYTQLNDSIMSEQQRWALEELQVRYEAIEKDKKIKAQMAEIALEKRKKFTIAIVAGIAFPLIMMLIYMQYTKGKKHILSSEDLRPDFSSTLDLSKINEIIPTKLTPRETEIILLVEKGLTNQEIAQTLFVSENTVKTHLKNIFVKTEAQNRTDLVHKMRGFTNNIPIS
jgi:ATP/maltotriose-dependent transcriptional regulator MalT